MRLAVGEEARPFVTKDLQQRPVDLNDYRGKPLLLSFFRTAACPMCSLRVWYYSSKAADWASRGVRTLAVFESDSKVTEHYCERLSVPFPLIPDPDGMLFRLYGVTQSPLGAAVGLWQDLANIPLLRRLQLSVVPFVGKGMFRMPADFLIAPDFTIDYAHYGRDVGDHINFDVINQFTHKLHPTVPLANRTQPVQA